MMVMAGMFAAQALSGLLSSSSKRKQQAAQNKATLLQNQRMLAQAGQEASQAYVEAGSAASQATGLLNEAGRLTAIEQGNQAVNAAASGTIGSSVDAVQMDLDRQEQQRKATIAEDLATQLANSRSKADAAYTSAINNFGSGQKVQSTGSMWASSLINAGLSTASSYLAKRA